MAKTPTKQSNGFVVIELSTPIKVDGADVRSIRMREPTVEDQLANQELDLSDPRKEVALFANLCMVSPDELKPMTMRDYRLLQKAYGGFLV